MQAIKNWTVGRPGNEARRKPGIIFYVSDVRIERIVEGRAQLFMAGCSRTVRKGEDTG